MLPDISKKSLVTLSVGVRKRNVAIIKTIEYNSYNLNIRGCFNGRENGNIS